MRTNVRLDDTGVLRAALRASNSISVRQSDSQFGHGIAGVTMRRLLQCLNRGDIYLRAIGRRQTGDKVGRTFECMEDDGGLSGRL